MTAERAVMTLERIPTGVERLDEVLDGGIPRYSTVFVAGLPGTGKTILSQQALFANARAGRKGLYLSTISEPPIKVLRFLQGFTFFDPGLFGGQVVYGDLGSPLRTGGPAELLRALDGMIREQQPELLVIDSFKAVRDTIQDVLAFREFTNDVAIRTAAWEVTTLLVGEYSESDVRQGAEFAIADGIFYLYGMQEGEKQKRYLQVLKMRGTSYFAGAHYFDITQDGITVYPRMVPEVMGEYAVPGGRTGSSIEGLDEMLGGGLLEGTSTIVSGSTGAGKTLMAMGFAVESARQGRPALYVSFEEGALQIERNASGFGWELEDLARHGLLDIYHVSPSELNVDRHAYLMKERADELGARIVVIDSISAFQAAVPDSGKYQSYMWAINDYFKRDGVTVVMTAEVPGIFGPLEISVQNISFVADNIIFLRFVEIGGEIKRAVGVLKMRGSAHDRRVREFIIRPPRIAVGEPLSRLDLVTATTPEPSPEEVTRRPEWEPVP